MKKFVTIRPDLYDFDQEHNHIDQKHNISIKPLLFRSRVVRDNRDGYEERVAWEDRAQLFERSVYSLVYARHKDFLGTLKSERSRRFDLIKHQGFHPQFMMMETDGFIMSMLPGIMNEYLAKVQFKNSAELYRKEGDLKGSDKLAQAYTMSRDPFGTKEVGVCSVGGIGGHQFLEGVGGGSQRFEDEMNVEERDGQDFMDEISFRALDFKSNLKTGESAGRRGSFCVGKERSERFGSYETANWDSFGERISAGTTLTLGDGCSEEKGVIEQTTIPFVQNQVKRNLKKTKNIVSSVLSGPGSSTGMRSNLGSVHPKLKPKTDMKSKKLMDKVRK